ncbi:ENR1 protein, partial [Emberiza fucata]|nr:ENR1 protein [Emberiza fucata]
IERDKYMVGIFFIDMVEKITEEFNLTDCWVCGGTHLSEIWPWDGISLGPLDIFKWIPSRKSMGVPKRREGQWKLKSTIIGWEVCLSRKGKMYTIEVGETPCKRYLSANDTHTRWIPETPHSYWSIEKTEI